MNRIFKALADPTRREIIRLLRQGEMNAGDLAAKFEMTKPTLSHHFSVLKEADVVTSRRDGTTIYYAINTSVLQDLMSWVFEIVNENENKESES